MATVENQRGKSAVPDKQLRELARSFKQGYRFERTGSGHWRIRDRDGRLVELDGRPLQVSGNPGSATIRAFKQQVEQAQIVKGTKMRVTDETVKARLASQARLNRDRQIEQRAIAAALRQRYGRAFKSMGGIVPGLSSDLGAVGAMLLREDETLQNGSGLKTPDLLTGSAYRMLNGAPVYPDYRRIWEAIADRLDRAPDVSGEWYTLVRQAKGLPDDTVHARVPKGAQGDWPFRVELLLLDALLVDETYQRPVSWQFVRREAARFDPTLVGTIDVAQRSPSRFAILDGSQRSQIVRLVGKTSIYCSVYVGLDLASEARHFLHKNRDRKSVHPFYTFRARVAADDGDAIAIEKIVEKHGYQLAIGAPSVGGEVNAQNIAAISAVTTAYSRKLPDESDTLDPTLAVLKRSTLGRAEGQSALMLRGVSTALMQKPDLDRDVLVETLTELGPQLLLGRARDLKRPGLTGEQAVARVLSTEYDRRKSKRFKS